MPVLRPAPPQNHPSLSRQFKATAVVGGIWGIVSLCHWQPVAEWGLWGLTLILTLQASRMLLQRPPEAVATVAAPTLPSVSILIPAKNEQAVIGRIIPNLFALDYPPSLLEIWAIDDSSTDATPEILTHLQTQFPQLHIFHHTAPGHKSAALNAVWPQTRGEILLICDADAQLSSDFLQRSVAPFAQPTIGAVQTRKSVANATTNFLTRCQQMEMACDCFLQIHRIAIQGMSELRGNGMLVRRSALEKCGGWNEDTITDDLDMTFRLYLAGTEIAFLLAPTIVEEGVTSWRQLWHQRRRWATGGYQRYLDYFPDLLQLGWHKELDLLLFCLLQFLLPIGIIPDLLWNVFYSHRSVLLPLQCLLSLILTIAFIAGLYQYQNLRSGRLIWATIQGSTYMLHWIPIMLFTTIQTCWRSQPAPWYKTEHRGK
jgi:1,2-diacylglycerol 3-beta-glucosyltransferase